MTCPVGWGFVVPGEAAAWGQMNWVIVTIGGGGRRRDSKVSPRRLGLAALVFLCIMTAGRASSEAGISPTTQASEVLQEGDQHIADLEMVIPFYEGVRFRNPPAVARDTGLADLELAYPGVLSAPFIAWRFSSEDWTALCAGSVAAVPVSLRLKTRDNQVSFEMTSPAPCTFKRLRVRGTWRDLVRTIRQEWKIDANGRPLSKDFVGVSFYVHQWVSAQDPPLRVNWTVEQLVEQMRCEQPARLQYVYGFDPGGVDVGGEYFWSTDTPAKVRAILGANTRLSHLSWLNLRTFKWAIPRLGIEVPLTPAVLAGAKKHPPGVTVAETQYTYKLVEMCLASSQWQESRLRQFDRLADMGFKVVELNEFPVPTTWQLAPCQAANHLHKPGDAASEWHQIIRFVDRISRRAGERGVRLICEEPSAALLPYTCGYIDRQYSDEVGFYALWKKSRLAEPIPLFSTMFGDLVTPYTDADPDRQPPPGWLTSRKMWPPSSQPSSVPASR
jgi:hypothetical protein